MGLATEQLEDLGSHEPSRTGTLRNRDKRSRHKVSLGQGEWPASPPGLTPRRDATRAPLTPSPQPSKRPLRDGDCLSSGIKLTFPAGERQPGTRQPGRESTGHSEGERANKITLSSGTTSGGRPTQSPNHKGRERRSAAGRQGTKSMPGQSASRQNGQVVVSQEATIPDSRSESASSSSSGARGTTAPQDSSRRRGSVEGAGDGSAGRRAGSMGDLRRAGSGGEPARNSGARSGRRRRGPTARRGSAGKLTSLGDEEAVRERLEHLKLEKEKADELAAQMAKQAQALMDERARMKADNDDLKRDHDMMVQRLQLLESLMQPGDEIGDFDEGSHRLHETVIS